MSSIENNLIMTEFVLHTKWGSTDIRKHIYHWELYENIWEYGMTGYADLVDLESLVEAQQIVGDNEFVTIRWAVSGTNSPAVIGEKYVEMDVFKTEHEKKVNDKALTVRIWFMSRMFRKNINSRVRKYYEGTQDSIVARLTEAHFKKELYRSEPCKLEENYIFPNWHPLSCINFLAKNSQAAANGDPDYLFFETIEGLNYVSASGMIREPEIIPTVGDQFRQRLVPSLFDPETDYNVEELHKKKSFDVVDNMLDGMYGASIVWHELINRRWRETGKTYGETFGEFDHNMANPLLFLVGQEEFEKKNKFLYIPTNPEESPGSYISEEMAELQLKLVIRQKQIEQNIQVMEMAADPAILVGYPLTIDYHSFQDAPHDGNHDLLWGRFLVTGIRHSCGRTKYRMFVEVSKDSYWKI